LLPRAVRLRSGRCASDQRRGGARAGPAPVPNMLGRRGKGHPERGGQLAEVLLLLGELPQHRPPRRVGQRVEDAVQDGEFI
jgi:hypothetical protein